jgi:hypothetical protein
MERTREPTDFQAEEAKGRLALWLDPLDIQWLAGHCCCPPDAPEAVTERCARIRFRAHAALHKAGIKGHPQSPRHRRPRPSVVSGCDRPEAITQGQKTHRCRGA